MQMKCGSPPFYDADPPRMSRSVGNGGGGSTFRIPNGAKYGLGEGKQPTRMGRSGGTGGKGSTFRMGTGYAHTSSRKDTGATSKQPQCYGVKGISGGKAGGYGGS